MNNTHQKINRTELVFILDRSGSMSGLEKDTIGGFNSLLEKQKHEAGECLLTTVLFDDQYELLHDRVDIREIAPITEREYWVRGMTALLDAIGKTIQHITAAQKYASPEQRADKVMFVITTDGMENASREYSYERIRKMIETQKKEFGWEFLFLGANIDAVKTASSFGISADRATNYHSDPCGTRLNYQTLSRAVSHMRSHGSVDACWKDDIEADYSARSTGSPAPTSDNTPDPQSSSAPASRSLRSRLRNPFRR